ncbi:MAG TPA: sigma-70 family RNA polymerase sigma factor [Fervidobacterium sp.]|nr:sigma-70 family RNA polymerase sigma factor [Fervidobacterium sp.]
MHEINWEHLFSDEVLYQRVKFFLLGSVKNMEVAEELTQETMAKAWEKRLTLKNTEKLEAWLFAIARNVLMDYYRHRGILIEEEDEQWESRVAAWSSQSQEEFLDLYNALDKLPSPQKQVIELRFFKNYTVQETAQIMGKTPQAVKMLQYRALRALRDYVKPFDELERLNNDGEY